MAAMARAGALGLTGASRTWLWPLIYACGAVFGLLRAANCDDATLCVEVYWIESYLLDYSDGLRSRALLGAIAHALSPGRLDIVGLNAASLAISLASVLLLIGYLHHKSRDDWDRATIAVIAASPHAALFFEALGDALNACALVTIAVLVFGRGLKGAPRWALAGLAMLVAVLIHEAAIFLVLPALVLYALDVQRPGIRTLAAVALAAAPFLILALAVGSVRELPDVGYRAYNPLNDTFAPRFFEKYGVEAYPSYTTLLIEEWSGFLGSPHRLVVQAVRNWYVPLLTVVLIVGVMLRGRERESFLIRWAFLTVCAGPLFIVAHDWGRFTTHILWMTLLGTLAARPNPARALAEEAGKPETLALFDRLAAPPRIAVFAVVTALIFVAQPINKEYRWKGVPWQAMVFAIPALAALWYGSRGLKPAGEAAPAGDAPPPPRIDSTSGTAV
jgi:hypothetical protein